MNSNPATATTLTREEVNRMKEDWYRDPCWDLEDVDESNEIWREELAAFSEMCKANWNAKAARAAWLEHLANNGLVQISDWREVPGAIYVRPNSILFADMAHGLIYLASGTVVTVTPTNEAAILQLLADIGTMAPVAPPA